MPNYTAAVLEAAVPILTVTSLPEALDYYQRILGFRVEWSWGEPPDRASVSRDGVELNLAQSAEAPSGVSKVYFPMAGVDAYYADLVAAGARVEVALADRAYGMRDFRIVDSSGNQLSFGESTHS